MPVAECPGLGTATGLDADLALVSLYLSFSLSLSFQKSEKLLNDQTDISSAKEAIHLFLAARQLREEEELSSPIKSRQNNPELWAM
jgi:hypothetical protein